MSETESQGQAETQKPIASSELFDGKRWEYLTGGLQDCWPDDEQKKLNDLGKQGWELVALLRCGIETRFYLKRPSND